MSASSEIEFDSYQRAVESLLGLIRGEHFASRSASIRRQRAEARLARTRAMLKSIGDPHRKYPVVHITGTSGKGSTAAAVAAVLTAAGYRAGLRTSPYLQVATEKLQIGSSLIDSCSFSEMVMRVFDTAISCYPLAQEEPPLTFAEAWSILGYWWFAERQVDIAVVEVGAGGRFDATNVIKPTVSVITSVGLDHLLTLGPTIIDIAWHKAGIIKPGSTAVVGDLPAEAYSVIAEEARLASVELVQVSDNHRSSPVESTAVGGFPERNARLAATVANVLDQQGFPISEAAIVTGIASARLPGRLERMPGAFLPAVWIDGAHNEDKMAALAAEIHRILDGGPPPVVVLGMLNCKDPSQLVAKLGSAASSLVLTEPFVVGRDSLSVESLAAAVAGSDFAGPVHLEPDPDAAVRLAEHVARKWGAAVLVTGSMYLAGQVRRRWYPDQDIVVHRTPWPAANAESQLCSLGPFRRLVRDKTDGERDQAADHQVSAGADEQVIRQKGRRAHSVEHEPN